MRKPCSCIHRRAALARSAESSQFVYPAWPRRAGIRVPLHRDPVRQLADLLAERLQQFLAELRGNRAARFEKRAVLAFEQFHPESLGCHREHHVFLDFLQCGRALDGLFKLVFELVHVVFMDGKAFASGAS